MHSYRGSEAYRLLGRAKAELGERQAACDAAERAVAQAAGAQYAWLEMLSLLDLLSWSEESATNAVRSLDSQTSWNPATSGLVAATSAAVASAFSTRLLPMPMLYDAS